MGAISAALIGCGRIGVEGHLPAYRAAMAEGLCRLVGVCDPDLPRAQAVAQQYGVPAFATAEELLAKTRPEMVSIATTPSTHRDLTIQALEAGCHVLCEKPVAMNLAEARAMVDAAARAGRLLSICFQYRYWDEAVYLRQRIQNGDFGHVHFVRTWGGAVRSFPAGALRLRRSTNGGGVLQHWTVHNLDLTLWLLGNPEPLTASAFCYQRLAHLPPGSIVSAFGTVNPADVDPEIEDFGVGFIRLAGGTAVVVEANYLQPPSARPEGWEILSDRAAASISPIRIWRDTGRDWIDETPPAGSLAPCDYDMARLFKGFLERIMAGGPAPVAADEILRIQQLTDALYASAAQGREVAVASVTTPV